MTVEIDRKRWCKGRVHELYRWTEALYSIRVMADTNPFIAGQFTKLGLVIGDTLISRPYSYVNAPHEKPLEFYFITVPDGPLSMAMAQLQTGDSIEVMRRPAGFLTLDEVVDTKHLWLLATGTALGPFLSMLKTETPWARFERIVLVHAVRFAAELSFQDTIQTLSATYADRFQFIPIVSREDTDFALRGRIPALVTDGRLEERAGLRITAADSHVMICGNPDMVKDTSTALQERGLARNRRSTPGQISVENYW